MRIENGPGNEILKVELLRQSRNVSNVIFEIKDKNSVEVSFDFFDPNDGFVVEIVHTGSRRSLYWKGTVRGIPEGISDSGGSTLLVSLSSDIFAKAVGKSTKFVMMIAALLGLAIAMLGLFREKFKEYDDILNWPSNDYPGPSWPMVFMGIIYAILPIIMMWMRRRRFPRSLEIEQVTTDKNLAVDQGTQ